MAAWLARASNLPALKMDDARDSGPPLDIPLG
jgi:hypothetical protein